MTWRLSRLTVESTQRRRAPRGGARSVLTRQKGQQAHWGTHRLSVGEDEESR